MNPNEKYYEANLERANRYHLNLDALQNVDSVDELANGYCVVPSENEGLYIYAFRDKELIAEGKRFNIYRFLILRLFIDKYSTGKYELPKITKRRFTKHNKEEAIDWNRKAMEILLRPLDTYESLLARFKEADEELGWPVWDIETFDGHESQENGKKALNGKSPDYESDEYRVIRYVEEEVWDIFSKKERSNDLQFMFRIYGRKYLHEYILNNHIGAVG